MWGLGQLDTNCKINVGERRIANANMDEGTYSQDASIDIQFKNTLVK